MGHLVTGFKEVSERGTDLGSLLLQRGTLIIKELNDTVSAYSCLCSISAAHLCLLSFHVSSPPCSAGFPVWLQWFFPQVWIICVSASFPLAPSWHRCRFSVGCQCSISACPAAHQSAIYPEQGSWENLLLYLSTSEWIYFLKLINWSNWARTNCCRKSNTYALHQLLHLPNLNVPSSKMGHLRKKK